MTQQGHYINNLNVARQELRRLLRGGQAAAAQALVEQLTSAAEGGAAMCHALGAVLAGHGQAQAAMGCYRRAIKHNPDDADAFNNLAVLLAQRGDYPEALAQFEAAGRLKPDGAEILNNIAKLRRGMGEYDAAVEQYRKALALRPDFAEVFSNLLFTLAYNVLCSPEVLLEEHREYGRRFGGESRARTFTHTHAASDTRRRLRIGYVSTDFKRHPVSYFFEPILAAHDRQAVEVYCYANVARPDEMSRRLMAQADHWCSTVGLADEALARRIHADGIDILVDLGGHTAHNRLPVFAYRPAPVQVTYLGYCTTTGLETMNYWITDTVLTPPDTVERCTEEIWRLPRCWLSYRPDPDAPAVTDRSGQETVNFGSFNNFSKLTQRVVALWSECLRAVPGSRLILKTREFANAWAQEMIIARFEQEGVGPERIELRTASANYLAEYGEIDIALDPFPRTGGATTADALWMGVPVVTLAGQRMIERQGVSMLHAVGLDELVASDETDYVAKIVALASDPVRRARLRAGQRQRMATSELCNGQGLAAALEEAYRQMWQRYVTP